MERHERNAPRCRDKWSNCTLIISRFRTEANGVRTTAILMAIHYRQMNVDRIPK
jgi:hypothetical protein